MPDNDERCPDCNGWGGSHLPGCSIGNPINQFLVKEEAVSSTPVGGGTPQFGEGVWLVWQMGNEHGEAVTWHHDPVAAIKSMADNCPGYGHIDWWPSGVTLLDLVNKNFGSEPDETPEPEDVPDVEMSPPPRLS